MRVPQFLNKSREIAERLGLRKDNFNLLVSCPTLNVAWQR